MPRGPLGCSVMGSAGWHDLARDRRAAPAWRAL